MANLVQNVAWYLLPTGHLVQIGDPYSAIAVMRDGFTNDYVPFIRILGAKYGFTVLMMKTPSVHRFNVRKYSKDM
jgi:hypothetical protein